MTGPGRGSAGPTRAATELPAGKTAAKGAEATKAADIRAEAIEKAQAMAVAATAVAATAVAVATEADSTEVAATKTVTGEAGWGTRGVRRRRAGTASEWFRTAHCLKQT